MSKQSESKMSEQLTVINDQADALVELITDGKAPATQAAYSRAVNSYVSWAMLNGAGFDRRSVQAFIQHLLDQDMAPATINQALSALRRLARELRFNHVIDGETADSIVAVEGVASGGRRLGHWLDMDQVQAILDAPNRKTLKGKQEYLAMALLLGCALRRSEAVSLTLDQLKKVGKTWVLADIVGKGNKTRSVPVPEWTLDAINVWINAAHIEDGRILRPVNRGDRLNGDGMTAQALYYIVKKLAKAIDLDDLGPHSLRRTWARTAYDRGNDLGQIQYILGHASIATTEIYLGLKDLDVDNPVLVEF